MIIIGCHRSLLAAASCWPVEEGDLIHDLM
jgi:hypothetical protein